MRKKVKLQMKTHFFNPNDSLSITKCLPTFKLAWDNNNFIVGEAMWVLPFFVKKAFATTFNSRMSAVAHINPVFRLNEQHWTTDTEEAPTIIPGSRQFSSQKVCKRPGESGDEFQDFALHPSGTHDSYAVLRWSLCNVL